MGTFIPSLRSGPTDILTPIGVQVGYLINFSLNNPGEISDNNDDNLLSFQMLHAEFGNDPERLGEIYKNKLSSVIGAHFPELQFVVEVTLAEIETGSGAYKLTLSVLDDAGGILYGVDDHPIDMALNR